MILKNLLKNNYNSNRIANHTICCVFEKGINLFKKKGILGYIIPSTWL